MERPELDTRLKGVSGGVQGSEVQKEASEEGVTSEGGTSTLLPTTPLVQNSEDV